MALENSYYVDSSKSDDSGDGITSVSTAKKNLSAVLALIDEPLTHDVTIHLKSGNSETYSGDMSFQGIRAQAGAYKLIIQPYSAGWDQTKYDNGAEDPLGGSTGFDPSQAEFSVVVEQQMSFLDCGNIELRGIYFKGYSSATGVTVAGRSHVVAKYCRFEGPGAQSAVTFSSQFFSENCYYKNCPIALLGLLNSVIHMVGDNTIEDAVIDGLRVAVDSMLVVRPMDGHPEHHTLSIITTLPRQKGYAGLRAVAGSTICIFDDSILPMQYYPWYQPTLVSIHHAHQVLRKEQYAVVLESGSLLTGAGQITCTMLDSKGDTVPMPEEQTIVSREDEGTTVKY
jgi:hypothetical protein